MAVAEIRFQILDYSCQKKEGKGILVGMVVRQGFGIVCNLSYRFVPKATPRTGRGAKSVPWEGMGFVGMAGVVGLVYISTATPCSARG